MSEKPTYEELEQWVQELAEKIEPERRKSEEALKNSEDRYRGVVDEGMCFIQKPFSKQDLATTVRKALDEQKTDFKGW